MTVVSCHFVFSDLHPLNRQQRRIQSTVGLRSSPHLEVHSGDCLHRSIRIYKMGVGGRKPPLIVGISSLLCKEGKPGVPKAVI